MEMSEIEKARAVMDAAAGLIETNEDFEIAVCGCKSAGMDDQEILSYLARSPKFDTEAKIRVKSFKAEGGRSLGSLIKWAKDKIGFTPSWHGERMELSSYPAIAADAADVGSKNARTAAKTQQALDSSRYPAAPLPGIYDNLSPIRMIHEWVDAVRSDGELTQIAASVNGNARKTPLISRDEIISCRSLPELERLIFAKFDPLAGAWVMLNPVHDSEGKNESVSSFKYLLWESDEGSLEQQFGAIKNSRVPVDAVIASGNKSLHAWVRVDAENADDYAEKARRFFAVLERHGADFDPNVKNPGRLCRLPGVMRSGRLQALVALRSDLVNCFDSFDEWLSYEENPHILPMFTQLSDHMEEAAGDMIVGEVIQRGDIVCLGGDQKIGKSWISEQLAAELVKPRGGAWLGMPIHPKSDGRGWRVFFLNAEIKQQVFYERMRTVMNAANAWNFKHNFACISLRSVYETMKAWKRELIAQIQKFGADIVIVDPIYTLIDGDENAACDMRPVMISLREISEATRTTMIITHHHRKGDMSELDVASRLAGSNVTARFVDTIIDMSGIDPDKLRDAGIETAIRGRDGLKRYNARGLRLDFVLRNAAEIAPRYFWRYNGGSFREDTSGVLEAIWTAKKRISVTYNQLTAVSAMLGACVEIKADAIPSASSSPASPAGSKTDNAAALVCDQLRQAARLGGEGYSIPQIVEFTGLHKDTVRKTIYAFRDGGCILETNPDRKHNEQALYIWDLSKDDF